MYNGWRITAGIALTVLGTVCWFATGLVEYFTRNLKGPYNRILRIRGYSRVCDAIRGAWKSSIPDAVLVFGVTSIVSGLLLPYATILSIILVPLLTFFVLWIVRCVGVFPKYISGVVKEEWLTGFLTISYWPYLLPLASLFIKKDVRLAPKQAEKDLN